MGKYTEMDKSLVISLTIVSILLFFFWAGVAWVLIHFITKWW